MVKFRFQDENLHNLDKLCRQITNFIKSLK